MDDEAVKINKNSKNQINIEEILKQFGFKKVNICFDCPP